jgi:hypothetical protein
MKERPVLFSGEMVRAIRDGRKSQTRRIVKPDSSWTRFYDGDKKAAFRAFQRDGGDSIWNAGHINGDSTYGRSHWQCGDDPVYPNYQDGDHLWVKETFRTIYDPATCLEGALDIDYRADGKERIGDKLGTLPWKPSIFMPRWASRITLEIVSVRVERVQEIHRRDAQAEGITCRHCKGYSDNQHGCVCVEDYGALWDSINGKKHPWSENPWVWVIKFRKL